MLYVAVIVGVLVVTCLIGLIGYVALKLFRESAEIARTFTVAHDATLKTLESVHTKNMALLSEAMDRFMSLDFSKFKDYQLIQQAEVGGFEEPEDEGEVEVRNAHGALVGASTNERLRMAANERQLLAEDFPDGWDTQ